MIFSVIQTNLERSCLLGTITDIVRSLLCFNDHRWQDCSIILASGFSNQALHECSAQHIHPKKFPESLGWPLPRFPHTTTLLGAIHHCHLYFWIYGPTPSIFQVDQSPLWYIENVKLNMKNHERKHEIQPSNCVLCIYVSTSLFTTGDTIPSGRSLRPVGQQQKG